MRVAKSVLAALVPLLHMYVWHISVMDFLINLGTRMVFLPTQASQLGYEIGTLLREIEEVIEILPVIPPLARGAE